MNLKGFFFLLALWVPCIRTVMAQQPYPAFFQDCLEARRLFYAGKDDSACSLYETAFASVPFVQMKYLKQAMEAAKADGNPDLQKWCKAQMAENKLKISPEAKAFVDSIARQDQRVRGGKYYRAQQYYSLHRRQPELPMRATRFQRSKELTMEWRRVDSTNIRAMLKWIHQNGFPGEEVLGQDSYMSLVVILLHFDADRDNRLLEPILTPALETGRLLPADYAWIQDRHLNYAGLPQLYYSIPVPLNEVSAEELDRVNGRRQAIGLHRLEEVRKVEVRGGVRVYPF